MRTHFAVKRFMDATAGPACGRGSRISAEPHRVDCLICQMQGEFIVARDEAIAAQEKAFQEQTPHTIVPDFGRVNDDGVMECYNCLGVLFRERPRSLFSFHFVCANEKCGKSMHPLTETGMST